MTATQAFRQQFGDCANFMTPLVMERGSTRHHHWELSRGERLMREGWMYGVTVLTLEGERTQGLSQSFSTEADARAFITTL